jgi:hypothetical protein
MPPLSTNVIEDDNASSSAISELDSDRFTYSGGDDDASSDYNASSDYDALSDSTPNVATTKSPRKRRQLATSTWQLARNPLS